MVYLLRHGRALWGEMDARIPLGEFPLLYSTIDLVHFVQYLTTSKRPNLEHNKCSETKYKTGGRWNKTIEVITVCKEAMRMWVMMIQKQLYEVWNTRMMETTHSIYCGHSFPIRWVIKLLMCFYIHDTSVAPYIHPLRFVNSYWDIQPKGCLNISLHNIYWG